MAISAEIKERLASKQSSMIRAMFEAGQELKNKFGNDAVFDFSLGNPDLTPPQEVLDAIGEVFREEVPGCHGYMTNAGYETTRVAIARKVSSQQGCSVTAKNVVMSCGAAGGLNTVFRGILNPGDEVLVFAPFFAEYAQYCGNYGGKLVPVDCRDDFSPDLDAMEKAITDKTVAVIVNSPNNPTGAVYSDEDITGLAGVLKRTGRDLWLIADEPYRDILYDGANVATLFDKYSHSVIVSSFAKNFSLPGERLGFVAVNPAAKEDGDELVAAVIFATRSLGFVNAPAFFQRVIEKSLDAKMDFSVYEKRRAALMKILNECGFEFLPPKGAFYIFCKVPRGGDDVAFCDLLKAHRILAVPGVAFGKSGYFRLSYCVSEQVIRGSEQAFKKAVAALDVGN